MAVEDVWSVESDDERFRAVIVWDEDPSEPYDDGSAPIVAVDYGSGKAYQSGPGTSYEIPADILNAAQHFRQREQHFARYLRIWHGSTVFDWFDGGRNTDCVFYTFDTADWRAAQGFTDASWAEVAPAGVGFGRDSEWRAYVEGESFGIVVERATPDEAWETVDSLWGFYGLGDYVKDEARRMLADAVEQDRAGTLFPEGI